MKKKSLNLFFGIVMLVALVGGLVLVRQNQDSRRGAYFAGTKMFLLPAERTAGIGGLVSTDLWLETDNDAKLSSADVTVCYDANLSIGDELDKQIIPNKGVLQELIVAEKLGLDGESKNSKQCVRMVLIASPSVKPENLKSGMVKLLTIRFTAVKEGSGEIIIDGTRAKIGGYNPAPGATDAALKVGQVKNAKFTITGSGPTIIPTLKPEGCMTDSDCPPGYYCYCPPMPTCPPGVACIQVMPSCYCKLKPTATPTKKVTATPTPSVSGNWPVLNYTVLYAFVKTNDSQCFVPSDWPLQIEVRADGERMLYTNVVPEVIGDLNGFVQLGGSLVLEGFNKTENVAAFMKGPKHLQMKYAVDGQSGRYGREGGELSLSRLLGSDYGDVSKVYDFTAYPILSGDVRGRDSDEPDGIVDGYDWVEIKNRAKVLMTVESGSYLKWDLDGSCQVNSNDLYQIRKTLEEKQGELY